MVTVHEDVCTYFIVFHWILHRMRNVSDESCRENQNTHFTLKNSPPPPSRKLYRLWDNAKKYLRAPQVTDDNTAHAHCMLDTQGYKHTLHCNKCCKNAAQYYVILHYLSRVKFLFQMLAWKGWLVSIASPFLSPPPFTRNFKSKGNKNYKQFYA